MAWLLHQPLIATILPSPDVELRKPFCVMRRSNGSGSGEYLVICMLRAVSSVSVNAQMAVFTSLKNVQNVQILRARRKENSSGELNTSRCLSSDVYTPSTKANEILVRHYVDWSAGRSWVPLFTTYDGLF